MKDYIHKFIKKQIEFYKQKNYIEIQIGHKVSDNIFRTSLDDTFINLVKEFRNYKLSYSQGKIYKKNDLQLKTFNNKNTEIKQYSILENEFIIDSERNYQVLILNNKIDTVPEFEPLRDYNNEKEYDEIDIHINDDILLVFQKVEEKNNIKILLEIDIDLPYKYLDNYISLVVEVLDKIDNENIKIIN